MATAATSSAAKVRARGITRLKGTFKTSDLGVVPSFALGTAFGRIVAVEYNPVSGAAGATTMDTGADITVTNEDGATLVALGNAGTAAVRVRPTCIPVVAAGTAVTPGAGYDGTKDVYVAGIVKMVIAGGGDAKVGTLTVIVDEGAPNDA